MRSIYFITLSRSDYASTRPVIRAALADNEIDAKVIAGGSHLLKRFGNTIEQIEKDGLPVHATADFLFETDNSPQDLAAAYARAVKVFVDIFTKGAPDAIFIVGDRWEMLAVASAASMLQIPVIHHSGGDITQGSSDNQTRYALSCLAHLHLVALPQHRERLLNMGEEDWRVITTGEPALTELAYFAQAAGDIYAKFWLNKNESFALATFHPTSFDTVAPEEQIERFLAILDNISMPIILTAPNPDGASELFFQKMKAFTQTHANVQMHESLGIETYYAAMAHAAFMIGNSSSGLWEAPSFSLPVINIGPRQQGRVHGDNVVNVALEIEEAKAAIAKVSAPEFRKTLTGANPYVYPGTLKVILDSIKQPYPKAILLAKHFIDPLQQ